MLKKNEVEKFYEYRIFNLNYNYINIILNTDLK